MSIVPASDLSSSDLALLGNNVTPTARAPRRYRADNTATDRRLLAAVQRSLASVGESVIELHSVTIPTGDHRGH